MAVGVLHNNQHLAKVRLTPDEQVRFSKVSRCPVDGVKRLYHADNLDVLQMLVQDKDVFQKVDAYSASTLPTTIDLNDCGETSVRNYYSSLNYKFHSFFYLYLHKHYYLLIFRYNL